MQHVLPPYFNKSRHYGLHQYSTKQRVSIPQALTNNGATIRTVFEILRQLLNLEPFACQHCGSLAVEKEIVDADPAFLIPFLQNKAPPGQTTWHIGMKTPSPGYLIAPTSLYS